MASTGKTSSGQVIVDAFSSLAGELRGPRRVPLDLFQDVPLFADLSKRHLRKIANLMQVVRYRDGRVVVEAGTPGNSFFVIADGHAKVFMSKVPVGRPRARLRRGDFFGEIAVLDGGSRSATVVADGPLVLLRLTRSAFLRLLRREPTVAIKVVEGLGARLRHGSPSE